MKKMLLTALLFPVIAHAGVLATIEIPDGRQVSVTDDRCPIYDGDHDRWDAARVFDRRTSSGVYACWRKMGDDVYLIEIGSRLSRQFPVPAGSVITLTEYGRAAQR